MATEREIELPDISKVALEAEKDKLDVQIDDDTPPQDRNRDPLPDKIRQELEDDNLEEYSEKVKQRISQARKAYHDERRAKETAAREKEEAVNFARIQYEENQALKKRLGVGEKVFITEVTKSATSEVEIAKERYKKALEEGDADKIVVAQDALTDAKMKLGEYAKFRPSLQEEPEGVQQPTQTRAPAQSQVDRKAQAWQSKNTWFGQDKLMTGLALGLHEELVYSGVDPKSDDYYEKIDATMKKRFPDYFSGNDASDSATPPDKGRRTNTTIVAPATRSSAPRQVRLTASQASLAKRLGITPEAYAREQLKLESNNG